MSKLHIFDLDGTLLRGSTACMQIAALSGHTAELVRLEATFRDRTIDSLSYADSIGRMWHSLTDEVVSEAFELSPWLRGITAVCDDIRARGELSAVITLSPNFFARHLTRFGFDEIHSSTFPNLPIVQPIDPVGILTPRNKVHIFERLRRKYAIPRSQSVAYGDSMSDGPLFRHLRSTVAVNGDAHLQGIAAASYTGSDLRRAYDLARTLLVGAENRGLVRPRTRHRRDLGAA